MNLTKHLMIILVLAGLVGCGSNHGDLSSGFSLRGIKLRCLPYSRSDLKGQLMGDLMVVGRNATSYKVQGPVQLETKGFAGRVGRYQATLTGMFTPPNRQNPFKTNYIDASISGSTPINGASISFWPERDDMAFSALYDRDGFRFGMDCSQSQLF